MDALNNNGIDYSRRLNISDRSHLVTALHRKIKTRLREIRNDNIWLDPEDICYSFKPAKLGLRTHHLVDGPWQDFVDSYERVKEAVEKLYRIELSNEEKEADLEQFNRLREILKRFDLVKDTVMLINSEIKAGKRILVEDCSSSSLDIDTGIYPYTSSYHTTTGAVCTGLGVPEEAIETSIGVMSAMTIIDRVFLKHIKNFPSQVLETEPCHQHLTQKLTREYGLPEAEFELGWTDLNLVMQAE